MFDMCTTGDTAQIDTIFKFLLHTRQHGCIDILHCCNDLCLWVSEVTWQWWEEYPVFDIPKKKKIIWRNVKGPRGGHSISCWSFPDARPIQRPRNTVLRYWQNSQWKWAGLPSCLNMNIGYVLQLSH